MNKTAKVVGTILGVVLFCALIAGLTYAYLISRTEKELTTGSGKFSIDYVIVQDITATGLSPSKTKEEGLKGIVKAKLSDASVAGKFNIYLTPKTIDGLNTSDALKYEVYINDSTTPYKTGNFNGASVGNAIKVVDSYDLTSNSTYTVFNIYIWLDNDLVTNAMFGKVFNATITTDSTTITGEF